MMRPVWVIDDDRSIRWVFEKALAREGIPFKTFAQATEAIEALDAAGAPQVLVSDIRMPGASGLELLQTLRQRFPDLPVIIMTAYSDLESAVAAFRSEEHTSELQSQSNLVCRLLLEKKKNTCSNPRTFALSCPGGLESAISSI